MEKVLNVFSIFQSIDGEVNYFGAGRFSIFIRLAGCNLRCLYCDTQKAWEVGSGRDMTVEQIVKEVQALDSSCRKVTITGGEPLLQKNADHLFKALHEAGYWISLETNGSIIFTRSNTWSEKINVEYVDSIIMDYKLPSSAMEEEMKPSLIDTLHGIDYVKFVISDKTDFHRAYILINEHKNSVCNIAFSPVFGKMSAEELIDLCKQFKLTSPRYIINLQLHKYIWPNATTEV